MSWYFLRPRGSIMVGDGRTMVGGFHRASIFPLPQTLLGAVRSKAGAVLDFDWDFARESSNASSKVTRIIGTPRAPGSLRIERVHYATRRTGAHVDIYYARPADTVVFPADELKKGAREPEVCASRPVRFPGVMVNGAVGLQHALAPLAHKELERPRKPMQDVPPFLGASPFMRHLTDPTPYCGGQFMGTKGPLGEEQTHVVIGNSTLAATEGGLFSSGRLRFDSTIGKDTEGGIAVELSGDEDLALGGTWRLGGRGSLADASLMVPRTAEFDQIRDAAIAEIAKPESDGRFRWILLTPARFKRGWLPDFLNEHGEGVLPHTDVRVRLCAAAVGRPLACSGWDLASTVTADGRPRGAPRPARMLVPAGSVYFLEAIEGGSDAACRAAQGAWLASLATIDADVANGEAQRRVNAIDAACGLARGVFGPWNWYNNHPETTA